MQRVDRYSCTMHNDSKSLMLTALAQTGRKLASGQCRVGMIEIVICGAVAGILGGELTGDRQTMDCDVIASDPRDGFKMLAEVAADIAKQFGLKPNWLNDEAAIYAHRLPAGWKGRLHTVGVFDALTVRIVSRMDLLALKLMGISHRPWDLEDIEALKPTAEEIDFLKDYLDQQEQISLDRESFFDQRAILEELRRKT